MLEVKGLCKHFSTHSIFKNLNLRAPYGEITSVFITRYKTVLADIIAGLSEYDAGQIYLNGRKTNYSGDELRCKTIYSPLNPTVNPNFSVGQNLGLLTKDKPSYPGKTNTDVPRESWGMVDSNETKQFTSGQWIRLRLCAALLSSAELVIINWPETELPLADIEEIVYLLQEIKTSGAIVIVLTNSINIAKRLSNKIVKLN